MSSTPGCPLRLSVGQPVLEELAFESWQIHAEQPGRLMAIALVAVQRAVDEIRLDTRQNLAQILALLQFLVQVDDAQLARWVDLQVLARDDATLRHDHG